MPEPKYVFICSPYRSNPIANTELTMDVCRVVTLKTSYIPLTPHLYFPSFLNDRNPDERNKGIEAGFKWLEKCSAVFVIKTNEQISEGMLNEINYAKKLSKPIIFFKSFQELFQTVTNTDRMTNLESFINKVNNNNHCDTCKNNHPHLLGCNGLCQNKESLLLAEMFFK